jgi:hypothetical protein
VGYLNAYDVAWWLTHRIGELVKDLNWNDVFFATERLVAGQHLAGNPSGGYGPYRPDLTHVTSILRKEDKDGLVRQLWREMCWKWPIIAKAAARLQGSEMGASPVEQRQTANARDATTHSKPRWDAISQQLWFGDKPVRTFSRRAPAQFENLGRLPECRLATENTGPEWTFFP